MEFQEYLHKQMAIFNYHLHSDYGLLIKTATCIAFGAVCGWIMGLVTWLLYKIAKWQKVLPVNFYHYQDDLDLDLELDTDIGYNMQMHDNDIDTSISPLLGRRRH
ncbi:uncharacterized protein Dvir_GJ12762, isoform A [Drosophila virilis]|uniref:Uncharacterized protein, isoform A n=1 Tax=Drosophila virilis TaxID=7244 RepID=B4LR32_DROVI|nr:uncharacterized protein Dvir_GJ12762, isoform A [Drosophila virilis]